jgi:hypothetical protein
MVAVEVRDDIRAILSSWAGLVAERASVCVPARAVPALAEFLRRNVDCLAEFSAVDDAVDEIADLCAAGQRVLSGATTRRVTIGACIRPRCPGTLIAMIRSPDSPSQSAIVCTVDGTHTWSSEQWHRLRTARPALACGITSGLTASEVATRWRIAPGTVYWLASEHGWRRYRDGRRVYYNLDDVVRTMEQRDAGE